MIGRALVIGTVAALGMVAIVAAQSPTTTQTPGSPTATVTPETGTPVPTVTTEPTATPTPEPEFNFDEVKEVVVPLIGDDGRTHYVTLTEDTAGIVRIRLSLFNFDLPFAHTMIIYDTGDCSASAGPVFEDVLFQARVGPSEGAGAALVLHFFNTDAISITEGPRTIYDADGTSLAIYRSGDAGPSLRAACAVLVGPPGAPNTGSGVEPPADRPPVIEMMAGVAAVVAGLAVVWSLRRRPG
ncbi:MAG: hypothetical protein WD557_11180 [Dehalococcoidia bacterium]